MNFFANDWSDFFANYLLDDWSDFFANNQGHFLAGREDFFELSDLFVVKFCHCIYHYIND